MTLIDNGGLTVEDLEALNPDSGPGDGRRYELLGGSIVVNAAPSPRHQRALSILNELVKQGCPPGHWVLFAPVDLDLPGGQRVEPDLVVVPHRSVGDKRLSLPVLLVVELVSSSTAVWDQVAKRDAYEAAGIDHYWMVDTRGGRERFTTLALRDGRYETVVDRTDRAEVEAPVAVSVPLAELFAPPG